MAKGDGGNAGEWGRAATNELIRSRIKIKSMNFMRGRTFLNKYVIIDEAQNLTPKQMKTLITRAGPGTKIICMGNLAQIDTLYLTEGSSGLTYAVDRFKAGRTAGTSRSARRTFAPGRLRQRGALTMVGWVTALKLVPWGDVIEATPQILQAAKKLLGATRKGQSRGDGSGLYRRRRDGSRPAYRCTAEAFA